MEFKVILGILGVALLFISYQFRRVGEAFFKQVGVQNYQRKGKTFFISYLLFGLTAIILSFIATKTIVFSFVILLLLFSTFLSISLMMDMKSGN